MRTIALLSLVLVMSAQSVAAQPTGNGIAAGETVTITGSTVLSKTVSNFVQSYASPSPKTDKIPKWVRGICPKSIGLTADLNLAVVARIKQVAAWVGAPVRPRDRCDANVTVIFSSTPQAVLDDMAAHHQELLGYHEVSQLKNIATMSHPIQAWYATATRDYNGTLHADSAQQNPQCAAINTQDIYTNSTQAGVPLQIDAAKYRRAFEEMYLYCGGNKITASRLKPGQRSEFETVTIVVDFKKITGLGIKPVASYIAMLALSQTEAFETCQPFVSITNLMTAGCDAALKPDNFSRSDIAYLSALYKMDPDNMLLAQQSDIINNMQAALNAQ